MDHTEDEPRPDGGVAVPSDTVTQDAPPDSAEPPSALAQLPTVPTTITVPLLILASLAIGYALYFMRPVLVPLVLALLVSYLVSPLVDWLQVRVRLPRAFGILAALIVTALLFMGIAGLVSSSVQTLAVKGPQYQARILRLIDYGTEVTQGWTQRFIPAKVLVEEVIVAPEKTERVGATPKKGRRAVSPEPVEVMDDESASTLSAGGMLREWASNLPFADILLRLLNGLVLSAGNLLLVLVFVIYLVGGRTPTSHKDGLLREIDLSVRRYIVIKVAMSALTGLLVTAILTILGLDLAVVFGVLAFLLNFIPSVGSIIATLLPLPIALVQFDSTMSVLLVLFIPGVLQVTIGNLVEPKIMGSALSLHPITILLALIFWGILWGVAGMLLAAPITAVLKIVLDRVPGATPISRLLEGKLTGPAAESS